LHNSKEREIEEGRKRAKIGIKKVIPQNKVKKKNKIPQQKKNQ
jgi:hypothetical protein